MSKRAPTTAQSSICVRLHAFPAGSIDSIESSSSAESIVGVSAYNKDAFRFEAIPAPVFNSGGERGYARRIGTFGLRVDKAQLNELRIARSDWSPTGGANRLDTRRVTELLRTTGFHRIASIMNQ
jgi:hypothetical protein